MPPDPTASTPDRRDVTLLSRWPNNGAPPPDLAILVDDDVDVAIGRAEHRDNRSCTSEQRRIHQRAARLYLRLATDDPDRVAVLDRRQLTTDELITAMGGLIASAPRMCLTEPWRTTAPHP